MEKHQENDYPKHPHSLGSIDSSTALAMDLPPLLVVAEHGEAKALLLTLPKVEVLAVLQHRFSFFWWVDRDPLHDQGILPFSSQRPPLGPGDKVGLSH